jgi:hypothetical protein
MLNQIINFKLNKKKTLQDMHSLKQDDNFTDLRKVKDREEDEVDRPGQSGPREDITFKVDATIPSTDANKPTGSGNPPIKSKFPLEIANTIVNGIWESIHKSTPEQEYEVIGPSTLPTITTWLTVLEDRVSDFPLKWQQMNKCEHDCLLLVLTLTKLIDDRKFFWLRTFEKTQAWFKKTLNDPQVCTVQKNVISALNPKKKDVALDFKSIISMFTIFSHYYK